MRVYLWSFACPVVLTLDTVTVTPTRLLLIAFLLPCLRKIATGGAGRVRVADIALAGFCAWAGFSLVYVHGIGQALQPSGILLIETMGSYLLARCYIRGLDDFIAMTRLLFMLVLCLLPFALFEAATGRDVLLHLFSAIFPTFADAPPEMRLGFSRARTIFEHAILFGICTGSVLALAYYMLLDRQRRFGRTVRAGSVAFTALLSLSSAPIAAVGMQICLIAWDRALHSVPGKWTILAGFALLALLVIAFGSNQSVVQFYISHFTFDQQTGWYRLLIWDFGTASVREHPLFGIGLNDWSHPFWMTTSVDMFWLLTAMRYGLPGGMLMLAASLSIYLAIGFKRGLDERLADARVAWMIVMTTFFLAGCTVHLWGTAYLWFLFLLGSGSWLLEARRDGTYSVSSTSRTRRSRMDGVLERRRRSAQGETGLQAR